MAMNKLNGNTSYSLNNISSVNSKPNALNEALKICQQLHLNQLHVRSEYASKLMKSAFL